MPKKNSPMYREPTEKERKKIEKAREMTQRGMAGEKDIFSKISTTMAKAARDDYKVGRKMMEEVPEAARNYEAETPGGTMKKFKNGGMVKVRGQGKVMKTKSCKMS
jgi:hypothetical protein